jgi:hypothetical protein
MSKLHYTVKTDLGEDGVGEMWSLEQAQAHVIRCEYEAHKINYEIIEHDEEDIEADITDSLLAADDSARGRKSRRKSSN